MKKLAFLAMVGVLTLLTACGGDDGSSVPNTDGRLTITGLNGYISSWDGIYGREGVRWGDELIVATSLIGNSDGYNPVGAILNGGPEGGHSRDLNEDSVTLKVWVWTGKSMEPYSGNDERIVFNIMGVWEIKDNGDGSYSYPPVSGTVTVDFVNGIGTSGFVRLGG